MSENDNEKGGSAAGGSLVIVEKTDKRQKTPFKPNDLQVGTDIHHKRSTAPAVPSVQDKLKHAPEVSNKNTEGKIPKESENAMSTEMNKNTMAKISPSTVKKRENSPESIPMAPLGTDTKKGAKATKPDVKTSESASRDDIPSVQSVKKDDEDSIAEEVPNLRIAEVAKEHSEWSDDEEAGGLPRSESRGSRVSRVVRQFFCCGVSYSAPSEENISTRRRHYSYAI